MDWWEPTFFLLTLLMSWFFGFFKNLFQHTFKFTLPNPITKSDGDHVLTLNYNWLYVFGTMWNQNRRWFSCAYCSFGFTAELKRIWQTLQEMIGRFVLTRGTPKVWLITAFCTGSIWGRRKNRARKTWWIIYIPRVCASTVSRDVKVCCHFCCWRYRNNKL